MWPHSTRSGVYIVNSRKKREGERGVPYRSGYNIFCRVFITIRKLPAFMSSLPLKCCCNSLTLMTCLYIWQLCSAPYRAILILAKPFSVRPATIPLWPTNVFTEIRWLASRRGVADRINDGSARNRSAEVRVLYNIIEEYAEFASWREITGFSCGSSRSEINCGSPGPIPNGWIENLHLGTSLGTSIIYRCNKNMKRIGASSATCEKSGRWSYNPPQCLCKSL